MRVCVIVVLFSLLQVVGFCQNGNYTGLGAYSQLHGDDFSFVAQPAALAQAKSGGLTLLSERKFFLPSLSSVQALIVMRTGAGNFGGEASADGSSGYLRWATSFSYGLKAGARISIGTRFAYSQAGAVGYDKSTMISGGIGMMALLTSRLSAGIYSETGFSSTRSARTRPIIYKMGLGYDVSELVHLSLQVLKQDEYPANVIAGIHYYIGKRIWVRGGISTATSGWWFGAGFIWKKLRIDLINNYHPVLGFSPGLLLSFSFNNYKGEK